MVTQIEGARGFLTDRQIRAALDEGKLISKTTSDTRCIRHSSYELRLGSEYKVKAITPSDPDQYPQQSMVVPEGGKLILLPGQIARLYTYEYLSIPPNFLALVLAKGLLFADALSPETTYLDPGYEGHPYITVMNVTSKTFHLTPGIPIARIFFYELTETVETPYHSADHLNVDKQLEAYLQKQRITTSECESYDITKLLDDVRDFPASGKQIAELIRLLHKKDTNSATQLASFKAHDVQRDRILFVALVFAFFWPVAVVLLHADAQLESELSQRGFDILYALLAVPVASSLLAFFRFFVRR
jgi:deoxycytidine triphosphate deaminase